MPVVLVDFGTANYHDTKTNVHALCEANVELRTDYHRFENDTTIEALTLQHLDLWTRCRRPLIFEATFDFDASLRLSNYDVLTLQQVLMSTISAAEVQRDHESSTELADDGSCGKTFIWKLLIKPCYSEQQTPELQQFVWNLNWASWNGQALRSNHLRRRNVPRIHQTSTKSIALDLYPKLASRLYEQRFISAVAKLSQIPRYRLHLETSTLPLLM